jgi:hypothetical protein
MEQQNLVFRYLERCNPRIAYRGCRFECAATKSGGSGEQFVRNRYPVEVKEHRRRLGKGASALLAVMLDADLETTQHRAEQLADALEDARKDCPPKEQHHCRPRGAKDPVAVLIPKRHVETWIRALLGNRVDEVTDYTQPTPTAKEIKDAAAELYEWTRPGANPGPTPPASLTASLPEWQKMPS